MLVISIPLVMVQIVDTLSLVVLSLLDVLHLVINTSLGEVTFLSLRGVTDSYSSSETRVVFPWWFQV
jgi:hypothetical protein